MIWASRVLHDWNLPVRENGSAALVSLCIDQYFRLGSHEPTAAFDVVSHASGQLCGRLAALYRSLNRYDAEVALLERYEATQLNEDARVRYKARQSKARSIAHRAPSLTALSRTAPTCPFAGRAARLTVLGPPPIVGARRQGAKCFPSVR
jgi:hypothetical protein